MLGNVLRPVKRIPQSLREFLHSDSQIGHWPKRDKPANRGDAGDTRGTGRTDRVNRDASDGKHWCRGCRANEEFQT